MSESDKNILIRIEKPFPNIRRGVRLFAESKKDEYDFWSNPEEVTIKKLGIKLPKVEFYNRLTIENGFYNDLVNITFKIKSDVKLKNYLYSFIGSKKLIGDKNEDGTLTYWWSISLRNLLYIIKIIHLRADNIFDYFITELKREMDYAMNFQTKEDHVFSEMIDKGIDAIKCDEYSRKHNDYSSCNFVIKGMSERLIEELVNYNEVQLIGDFSTGNIGVSVLNSIDYMSSLRGLMCKYLNNPEDRDYLSPLIDDVLKHINKDNYRIFFPCNCNKVECEYITEMRAVELGTTTDKKICPIYEGKKFEELNLVTK